MICPYASESPTSLIQPSHIIDRYYKIMQACATEGLAYNPNHDMYDNRFFYLIKEDLYRCHCTCGIVQNAIIAALFEHKSKESDVSC